MGCALFTALTRFITSYPLILYAYVIQLFFTKYCGLPRVVLDHREREGCHHDDHIQVRLDRVRRQPPFIGILTCPPKEQRESEHAIHVGEESVSFPSCLWISLPQC